MIDLDYILLIFISLSLAELAIQITISELAHYIKGILFLNPSNKLDMLCKKNVWQKLLGKAWTIAIPLIFMFNINKFFSKMLACPYCIGFHLGWISYWLILGMPIFQSLLFAPLVLVGVAILDKIHS